MAQIFEILGLPLLACIIMSSMLGYLGIHVLKREVIFVDIALAQIAAVGSVAAHLIFKVHSDSVIAYLCSFGCVLIASGFYAFVKNQIFQISLEAVIGISYALAAAAVLFIVGIAPGAHTHIGSILSGSLLWVNMHQIIIMLTVFFITGFAFYLMRDPITQISNTYHQNTYKSNTVLWDFVFYLLLGIVIIFSVQIGGIVIVFSYLIIPAAVALVLNIRAQLQIPVIWISALLASSGGLIFAYYFDFSIGPVIALFLGGELVIAAIAGVFWG